MTGPTVSDNKAKREYAQLLHLHERIMKQLQMVLGEAFGYKRFHDKTVTATYVKNGITTRYEFLDQLDTS